MSMSMHVVGIKPPDDTWKKMLAVREACIAAGVAIPREVYEYFGNEVPDPNGVVVDVRAEGWKDHSREGLIVNISTLPKGVNLLRFYCQW